MSAVYYRCPIIDNISSRVSKSKLPWLAVKCLEMCYCKSLHSTVHVNNVSALLQFGPSITTVDCQSAKTSSLSAAECVRSCITTAVCYCKFLQFTSQEQIDWGITKDQLSWSHVPVLNVCNNFITVDVLQYPANLHIKWVTNISLTAPQYIVLYDACQANITSI